MLQSSAADRLDRHAPRFARRRLANACSRAGKISARKSVRRLLESIVLAGAGAAWSRAAGAGFAAFETGLGRVHRDRRAQSDCRSSIGRRLRDFGETQSLRRSAAKARSRDSARTFARKQRLAALSSNGNWKIETASGETFPRGYWSARMDATLRWRICAICCRARARTRGAASAHPAAARILADRIVLQFLPEGYSGQAPVNETELNLCLVGTPPTISRLRQWAEDQFEI